MKPLITRVIESADQWNVLMSTLPAAHILQSWEWGDFKARTTGWQPERLVFENADRKLVAAASLLTRRIGPLRVIYVSKGPVFASEDLDSWGAVLKTLQKIARRQGAIWLKIDPDVIAATGLPVDASFQDEDFPHHANPAGEKFIEILHANGWRFSLDQVQFRNTLTLDLTQTEEALLAGMNQSTRRKIRHTEKNGVVVRVTEHDSDLRALYNLYAETGKRQGFIIRPVNYYLDLWQTFIGAGLAQVWLAEFQGQILAGVVVFRFGQKAWYFYGMSAEGQRDLHPTYALQWAVIRRLKAQGYRIYDWWGAPNEFIESDPMWGVFRFKSGFGGQVVRHIGAWDYVPYRLLYFVYTQVMPRLRKWLARRHQTAGQAID